jgi:hypothetical protein
MLFLKYVLLAGAIGLFMTSVLVVLFDAQRVWHLSRSLGPGDPWPTPRPLLWGKAARLTALAGLVMLPALSLSGV